jgi:hypothetical protein
VKDSGRFFADVVARNAVGPDEAASTGEVVSTGEAVRTGEAASTGKAASIGEAAGTDNAVGPGQGGEHEPGRLQVAPPAGG